ncbi:hypothetical protein LWI28_022020 [Acer negundo]|uniref:Uncharacterized protein n=1 Tax=Acer negundo TaxID=4023 RepID=A0AAD5NVB1_ACENE|nr:hypothetical protein LWI28_022020 [Acer negundo]
MANNKVIAVVFMFIVVVAAQQVQNAVAEDKQDPSFKELFKACYNECHGKCTSKGSSSTYCEVNRITTELREPKSNQIIQSLRGIL